MDLMLHKLTTDAKLTQQDLQLFIDGLERREHALTNRLTKAMSQKVDYVIPESLKQKLLREIFLFETDHNTKVKVEQIMAKQASMLNILKKLEVIIRSERYKIKVEKAEPSGSP